MFLPLKWLVQEVIDKTKCNPLENVKIHATVFEDNQGTCILAKDQRITTRTKHLLAKWHWFWDLHNQKEFELVKCPTKEMTADFLTKPLPRPAFEHNRKLVMGW